MHFKKKKNKNPVTKGKKDVKIVIGGTKSLDLRRLLWLYIESGFKHSSLIDCTCIVLFCFFSPRCTS